MNDAVRKSFSWYFNWNQMSSSNIFRSVGNEFISDLPPDTRETLIWRIDVTILNLNPTICFHHKYVYLKQFAVQQKSCCDPFSIHKTTCSTLFYAV